MVFGRDTAWLSFEKLKKSRALYMLIDALFFILHFMFFTSKMLYCREPRGFGFVQYLDPDDAAEAKYQMDGQILLGRELTVVFAEENRKKPSEMRARDRFRGRSYDRRGSSIRYSRSPSRGRSYRRSPSYYSPTPRRDRYYRSISPRDRRYRERSYSRTPYRSVSRSLSRSPVRSRSWSRSPEYD
ncbi:uncharacterized protein [Rutidosis leptorrhynchoides]|uniref:uncharacterized protein isoform X2 n=1 Tax=Rutidosis leptorrhynchoides TaxID=125765 RepID=UPI003A9A24FD